MSPSGLQQSVAATRGRLLRVHAGAGFCWAVLAGAALMIAAMWLDLAFDLPAGVRGATWALAAVAALLPMILAWRRAAALAQPGDLALTLDRAANAQGQIHAAADLLFHPSSGGGGGAAAAARPTLTGALCQLAIQKAARLAAAIPPALVVPAVPAARAGAFLAALLVALGVITLAAPRLVGSQMLRFADPYGDHPPYSSIVFAVEPGNARVIYGAGLPVKVSTTGGAVDRLDLVMLSDDLAANDALPMFSSAGADTPASWSATVTNLTTPGWYYIRGVGTRSKRFRIDIITVPRILSAAVVVTPPAYTNRPAYDGPIPAKGIAGLPGTKVKLTLKSNRPLAAGLITLSAGGAPIPLAPVTAGASEVSGSFVLKAPGRLKAIVTDTAHQDSPEPLWAGLAFTADERPFVRILQPLPQSFSTPDFELPVELSAEDDYGISRLQFFRGVNDSRPLPKDLPIPAPAPTLLPAHAMLPLASYGLKPGDTIKLFARVEDTDPAGPKGSESPVVVVTIISHEQMEQFIMQRDSMETLLSKYEQANRRLEDLDQKLAELAKEFAAVPSASQERPLSAEQKKKLDDLARQMVQQEQAVRDAEKEKLPFDLDKALAKSLDGVADAMKDAGEQTKSAATQPGMTTAGARKKFDEIRSKLGVQKQEFQKEATDPLDRLADIFPLQEDQARFEQIYEQQRDLEIRLSAMKGLNGEDNPELKARMRDLETEQRDLRKETQTLLDDIENHAAALPDDPELNKLKKSAAEFSKAVRESTAVEEMASAESGLAQFSGLLAHQSASVAADLLEQFLARQCKKMGDQASQCLKFQPMLAENLGQTVEQLLAAEGLGSKPGGCGLGNGGGYSMKRNSLRNVGLYGHTPIESRVSNSNGGRAKQGLSTSGTGAPGTPGNPALVDANGKPRASGASDAAIPQQYRRQVGDYFQRVADEVDTGDAK